MGWMVSSSFGAVLAAVGLEQHSRWPPASPAWPASIFPLQIEERMPVDRVEGFDRAHLPLFSRLETVETKRERLNPETLTTDIEVERSEVLVEPVGYLFRVAGKMAETVEIALGGGAGGGRQRAAGRPGARKNFSPHPVVRGAVRGLVGLFRAAPELVSALFLVLAYGFGPIPGVLALAIHGVGFLGKFYADEIENADPKPQDALRAIGAGPLKVLRFAVLPQTAPQFVAYTSLGARPECPHGDGGRARGRGRHRAGAQGPLRHVQLRPRGHDPGGHLPAGPAARPALLAPAEALAVSPGAPSPHPEPCAPRAGAAVEIAR